MVFVSLTNKTFKILISIRDEKTVKVTDVIHYLTYSIPFLEIIISSVEIKNEAKYVVDSLYQLSGSFRHTTHLHDMKVQLLQFINLKKLIKNLRWRECFVVSDFSKLQHLSSEKKLEENFSKIAEIYDALYHQNIKIMRGFEYQLFCAITMVFVSLTNKTFKILISIRDEKTVKVTDVIHYLTYSIPFLEIIISSVEIKNEAKYVVDSLYQLSGSFRHTTHLHDMVDSMLLQIRHEQVECSILGLFILDGTLFLRAFESHVGALIVLIQSK
ncbi:hypothetical protein WA026_023769 [Henosepilachna vigintioctopunctata]|uniref:Gustatory receptor n=1 Tax=Henosepilachna vigintioctopunctata TaxID=420089 RepID=A0AAW1VBN5_9CUCU